MNIWVIITTTIYNRWGIIDPKKRETEYADAITQSLGHIQNKARVIIVENSCMFGTSCLDRFGNIEYTKNNRLNVPNKGIIEFLDIQSVINKYHIPDTDIVVKLTGRYSLVDSSFLDRVIQTKDIYDAWMKFFNVCTEEFMEFDCVMGCYAVKCHILKALNPGIIGMRGSMEVDFSKFIRLNCKRIDEIQHLGLKCNFAGDGRELIC